MKITNVEKIAGLDSYIVYGKETTYGTATGTIGSACAYTQSFNPTIKNNVKPFRGFVSTTSDGRAVDKYAAGQLEVSWDMDIIPNSFGFMEYVLGTSSYVGTTETTTYEAAQKPRSFTMSHNIQNASTAREETYLGCVANSFSLKAAVGEAVSVSLSGLSSNVRYGATLDTNVAYSTDEVWTFQHGTLNVDGDITNIIDSVELTIENNWETKYGLGSRLVKTAVPKERDISLKFTVKYLNDDVYSKLLGAAKPTSTGSPTAVSSTVLTFTNGNKTLTITLSDGYLEDFSETANLNELIVEDFTLICKSVICVWDNSA